MDAHYNLNQTRIKKQISQWPKKKRTLEIYNFKKQYSFFLFLEGLGLPI